MILPSKYGIIRGVSGVLDQLGFHSTNRSPQKEHNLDTFTGNYQEDSEGSNIIIFKNSRKYSN